MEIDLTQVITEAVNKANSSFGLQRLEHLRPQIMKYLSDNCLHLFRQKVAEVYQINSFRKNIVPLEPTSDQSEGFGLFISASCSL